MKTLAHLLKNNADWSQAIKREDPVFFSDLAEQQSPEYMWIGCADSRVPPSRIFNLKPGHFFEHRNVANLIPEDDPSCLSSIQFAVDVLKVKHIIVCGHYGCGGIQAAIEGTDQGIISDWLKNVKQVIASQHDQTDSLSADKKFNRLCELNAIAQAINVCNTQTVQQAWQSQQTLSVHAWIYNLADGLIYDLDFCVSSTQEASDKAKQFTVS